MIEFGKAINHQVTITAADNKGYLVQIGCKVFAFSEAEGVIDLVSEYIRNPKGTEERYYRSFECKSETPPPPGTLATRGSAIGNSLYAAQVQSQQ